MQFKDDIVLENASKPFSKVLQSSSYDRNEKVLCSLCANAGIESVIRDNICPFCGDVGIKHGVHTANDDELFVVNSIGGNGGPGSAGNENKIFSTSFGGLNLPSSDKKPPQAHKSLQDALKETEISK